MGRTFVFFLLTVWWGGGLAAAQSAEGVTDLLKRVEERYNTISTLQASFTQTLRQGGRTRAPRSGTVYLRKPGRTRWEYTTPAGDFFLSDGKFNYDYDKANNEVTRTKVREDEDMRVPLSFLLGRLNFTKDFNTFRSHPDGVNRVIEAAPANKKSPFEMITMVVAPDASIQRVTVLSQDGSSLEFTLSDEQRNPKLADTLFQFKAPAGARVVDGE